MKRPREKGVFPDTFVFVQCPDCKELRQIRHKVRLCILRGENSGRCEKCASKRLEKPLSLNRTNPARYSTIHRWLHRKYGFANHCENTKCAGTSKTYDYAKRPECDYDKKIENFIQLCRKCHKLLDHFNIQYEV